MKTTIIYTIRIEGDSSIIHGKQGAPMYTIKAAKKRMAELREETYEGRLIYADRNLYIVKETQEVVATSISELARMANAQIWN